MIRSTNFHFIKICGITRSQDARVAIDAGATALGFVFVPQSPRYLPPTEAAAISRDLPPHVARVGLFVNASLYEVRRVAERCELTLIQLHGEESPAYCRQIGRPVIKAFRVRTRESLRALERYDPCAYLLDAYAADQLGGTGRTFPWELATHIQPRRPLILAGGLTPENVAEAIQEVRPYGVDVSSGVERAPGRKDPMKVRAFVQNAREAWDALH